MELIILRSVLVVLFILFVLFLTTLDRILKLSAPNERTQKKICDSLCVLLMEAFVRGKIQNAKDVEDFINGSDDINSLRRMPITLKDILLKTKYCFINSRSYDIDEPLTQINNVIKEVEDILLKRQLSTPFDGVPLQERNLLTDILELSQKKEEQVFRDKVHQLAGLVRAREEALVKSGRDNEESLKVGKQSKYIGIISLILAILVIAVPWIIGLLIDKPIILNPSTGGI